MLADLVDPVGQRGTDLRPGLGGALGTASQQRVEAAAEDEHSLDRVALRGRAGRGEGVDEGVQLGRGALRGRHGERDEGQLLFDQAPRLAREAPGERPFPRIGEETLEAVVECLHPRPAPAHVIPRQPGGQTPPRRHRPDGDVVETAPHQHVAREAFGRLPARLVEVVDLVEDDVHAGGVPPQPLDEPQLGLADRRVDRDHDERRVSLWQRREGRLGVVPVGGAEARHVDEHDPGGQAQGQLYLDSRHAEAVAGVARLVDVVADLREPDLAVGPVVKADASGLARTRRHACRDGRHGKHASRKEIQPREGVQERGLPALELAGDHDDEASFPPALRQV